MNYPKMTNCHSILWPCWIFYRTYLNDMGLLNSRNPYTASHSTRLDLSRWYRCYQNRQARWLWHWFCAIFRCNKIFRRVCGWMHILHDRYTSHFRKFLSWNKTFSDSLLRNKNRCLQCLSYWFAIHCQTLNILRMI